MSSLAEAVGEAEDVLALRRAVSDHKEAELQVKLCRSALRIAEQSVDARKAAIGAAVRTLRGRLGISADTMARRYIGGFGVAMIMEYIKFEDEGALPESLRKRIVEGLLKDAADADGEAK